MHLSVGDMLRTVTYSGSDWTTFITRICQSVCYALRLGVSLTMGHSPAQMVFNRDMLVPGRLLLDWEKINASRINASNTYLQSTNKKRSEHQYKIGDQVLLIHSSTIRSKLQKPSSGPFTITRVHNHGTVRLDKGRYGETVSIRNIRPFHS